MANHRGVPTMMEQRARGAALVSFLFHEEGAAFEDSLGEEGAALQIFQIGSLQTRINRPFLRF